MSNKMYDRLKLIALIITPIIVFISTICNVWNVQYTEQICATLAAIDVLVGAIVAIAKKRYDEKMKLAKEQVMSAISDE